MTGVCLISKLLPSIFISFISRLYERYKKKTTGQLFPNVKILVKYEFSSSAKRARDLCRFSRKVTLGLQINLK